jgi:membrane dipeptidase
MMLFDAHLDLALNGVDLNRDLRQTVDDIRAQEITLEMTELGRKTNTLSFPELKASGLAVCLTTMLARLEQPINHSFGWTSPQTCYAMAHAHLAYYRAMERSGVLKLIRTKSELASHIQAYASDPVGTPLGYILTMEGADPLLTPDTVFEFYDHGLRALGLTHYGTNRYGGGTRSEVGLSLDALQLLANCDSLGITIDMTHLSDVAFWQVAEHFPGRVHASHQNARGICNWQRQFSDEQIRLIIERDGVLGVSMDVIMLQEGYVRGVTPPKESLERAVDQIEYVRNLGGSIRHIGIGSDLDGGYGNEQTPIDLRRYRDLQKMVEIMQRRGFSDDDIQAVFYGNWLRFFSEVLPDTTACPTRGSR